MMGTTREEHAKPHQRLFHGWIYPLIRAGRQRPLNLDDLHPLPPEEDSLEQASQRFRQAYAGRLLPALFAAFKERFIKILLLLLSLSLLGLLRPLLLRDLIARFGGSVQDGHKSFFSFLPDTTALALFAVASFALLAFARTHFLRHSFKMTWAMPGLLRHEVYNKLLHIPQKQRTTLTTGEYVNIATRDCDSTSMLAFLLEALLYPLEIAAYCAMLVYFLGPWALLAVIALAAIIPLDRRLERRMSKLAADIREQSRLRLGILSEIFSGIRVIKFHAWEDKFAERVMSIREQEVMLMRERARVAARHSALTSLLPILTGASIVTLVAFLEKVPSTADVFASFSVITALVFIFSNTPDYLQNLSELRVSLSRIGDFLSQPSATVPESTQENAEFSFKNANLSRTSGDETGLPNPTVLHDVTLKFKQGQRIAIVGAVGAGKSTLLSACLGEMTVQSGEVCLPNPVAFAPQIAWNQNASVRDNIVFQLRWNQALFDEVIFASALSGDLGQWDGGAECEVGERGINLSGGQKQRLALARTLYSARSEDIGTVIWDDPFSALDETVANHIFEHGLNDFLSGKTRIFSTHRIDFALRSDYVVVMSNGRISEQGMPSDLLNSQGEFANLVALHERTRGADVHRDHQPAEQLKKIDQPTTDATRLMTEEKIALPTFNKEALNEYIKALAPALGLAGVVFIFLLPRLADVGSNLWLGHWTSQSSAIALPTAMAVFAVLTFMTVLTERGRTVVLFDGGVRAGTTFFKRLMGGVFNAPMRFFDTSPQGRILNRFTSDTTTIDSSMPSSVGQFLGSCVGIFASVLPVIWGQPMALFVLIPATMLYIHLFRTVRGAQLRLNALSQTVRSPWMSLTAETVPGLSVIRSLRAQELFMARYRTLINRHISTGFYVVAVNLWFAFRLEMLGVALVGGFIFAMLLSPGAISTTLAAVGLTFSLQMIGILGGIARSLRFLENALVSVGRVSEYSSLPPERTDSALEVPDQWPANGSIELNKLTAAYDDGLKPVLSGITLSIKAGNKVGIVGRTGSGKSTLFLALTRMIPIPPGMIFIDGVDISRVPLKRLRQSISMIPQDPVLFSGTLKDNLDPFGQQSDAAITTALRRAHLDHLCVTAESAGSFKIEENGRNLSVGERQLVCLARALLSRTKILLIDEATANVDVATDAKIQQTLREEFTHCTRLVIAHRTNTLNDADALVRIDKGVLMPT